jgi:hypothetical protein
MYSYCNKGTASPMTSTIREGFHEAMTNRHMPHPPVLEAVQPCLWTEAEEVLERTPRFSCSLRVRWCRENTV